MGSLDNLSVLVTRPSHQAGGLCRLIETEGGRPIRFPVLEIQDPQDKTALHAVIDRLDHFDIAIFISANAVERALNQIRARRTLPPGLLLAAVGKASARELQRLGLRADIVPPSKFDSEGLLATEALQNVAGKRIVIFRGEGGRELLAETLAQRGARVEYAEVYRRVQPRADVTGLMKLWARGEIDVVVVTSNESLQNLFDMVGPLGRQWLRETPLVVISERTAELAHSLGFRRPPSIASQASDTGLVEAIARWRRAR